MTNQSPEEVCTKSSVLITRIQGPLDNLEQDLMDEVAFYSHSAERLFEFLTLAFYPWAGSPA
jgi:hypothetical protein